MTADKKDGEVVAVSVKELGYIVKYVACATKEGMGLTNLLQELREFSQYLPSLPQTETCSRRGSRFHRAVRRIPNPEGRSEARKTRAYLYIGYGGKPAHCKEYQPMHRDRRRQTRADTSR